MYARLADKPYESFYMSATVTIAAPIDTVWPKVLDIPCWMDAHELKIIDDHQNDVGHFARVYPRNLGADVPEPHYHLYGIAQVIPRSLITLEVFPEAGGSYGNDGRKLSFDTIFLEDHGTETKITFNMIDIQLKKFDDTATARRTAELENARSLVLQYFETLKTSCLAPK